MKRIINGKLYDTDKAKYIGGFETGGSSCSDFNFIEQDIYKTESGIYLLKIFGGANTKYCISNGNMRYGGEYLEILTIEELLKWLEENNHYFGSKTIDRFLEEINISEG